MNKYEIQELASYNTRVSQGIEHTKEFVERMKELQIRFNNEIRFNSEQQKKIGMRIVMAKPTRSFRQAMRYWLPHRLTLKCNPRVHAWLWWNF